MQKQWISGRSVVRGFLVGAVSLSLMACGSDEDERSDAEMEVGGTISQAMEWEGDVTVTESVTLKAPISIKPCTTIHVASGASIYVDEGGSLVSVGEEDCPIVFRSAKSSPGKGDWNQIVIYKEALNENAFEHTHIFHANGEGGEDGALFLDDGGTTTVEVKNVRFEEIRGNGVYVGRPTNLKSFSDVHFKNVGGTAIIMGQNEVDKLENITAEGVGKAWIEIMDLNSKVTRDAAWKKLSLPYYVNGMTIEAKLELAAGTQMLMAAGSAINVQAGGTLLTEGVEADPVVFQSFKGDPAEGDWYGIRVYADSSNDSELNHTVIRHGGLSDNEGAMYVQEDARITLNDVVFEANKICDVSQYGEVVAENTSFVACDI